MEPDFAMAGKLLIDTALAQKGAPSVEDIEGDEDGVQSDLLVFQKSFFMKYVLAKVDSSGVAISKPFALDTKWDLKAFVNPSKHAVGSW